VFLPDSNKTARFEKYERLAPNVNIFGTLSKHNLPIRLCVWPIAPLLDEEFTRYRLWKSVGR
jgi:hypothetical protein